MQCSNEILVTQFSGFLSGMHLLLTGIAILSCYKMLYIIVFYHNGYRVKLQHCHVGVTVYLQ